MEQLAQVVQAAGDGALVCVGVLEVLVGYVRAGEKGALGLVQPALVHLDDARVQVGRCGPPNKIKRCAGGNDGTCYEI